MLKTEVAEGWHFYNRIEERIYDFTNSQFMVAISYDDLIAMRFEAFADTSRSQYEALKKAFLSHLA